MCLNFSQDATLALQQGEWPIKAYKVLRWDFNGHLLSPYHSDFEWRSGVNQSDRPSAERQSDQEREIARGIHVFLHYEQAKMSVDCEQVVVELICQREHLVGAGSDNGSAIRSAVFTEVTLTDEEYARAIEAAGKLVPEDEDDYYEDEDDWEDDEEEDEEEDEDDFYEDDWEDEDDDWLEDEEEEEEEEDWDD